MYFHDNFKTYNYEKNANNSSLNNFIQNLIGRFKPMQNFLTPKFTNLKKKWGYHTRRLILHLLELREILLISTKRQNKYKLLIKNNHGVW